MSADLGFRKRLQRDQALVSKIVSEVSAVPTRKRGQKVKPAPSAQREGYKLYSAQRAVLNLEVWPFH